MTRLSTTVLLYAAALISLPAPILAQTSQAEALIARGRSHDAVGDSAREQAVALSQSGQSPNEAVRAEVDAYELAIQAYTEAIEADPESAEAYRRRALSRAKRDRDGNQRIISGTDGVVGMAAEFGPESLSDVDRAISLAPDDPENHFVRGEILQMQFRNTWVIFTGMPEGEFGRSMVKPDADQANEAISSYARVAELDPARCEALVNIGEVYFLGFKFDGALDYLTRADECGIPQDAGFLTSLGEIAANPTQFFPESMLSEFDLRYPPGS